MSAHTPSQSRSGQTIRQFGRRLYIGCVALLSLALLIPNLRLYRPSIYSTNRTEADVVPQLNFVGDALRHNAGERMQRLFPEGFFFTHVLYGLTWVEMGLTAQPGTAHHTQALREARWSLQQLDSPAGRAPFLGATNPPLGVFYVGWSTWLRGGILKLQPSDQRDVAEIERFVMDCALLAEAFDHSTTPFLAAYPHQAWPVDSVVAIAGLRLHDTLLPTRFKQTIDGWLSRAQSRLDPATGLLPHQVDSITGQMLQGARGSSQSLLLRFLPEVDAPWASEQYRLFRQQFVTTQFGVPAVREYPLGIDGEGDVDSGPLIFGISASATVVALGAARVNGDQELSQALVQAIDAAGMPLSWNGQKWYGFGQVPVGDAFLAWAKAARPTDESVAASDWQPIVPWWWRLPLNAGSVVVIALLLVPLTRRLFKLGTSIKKNRLHT